MKVWAGRLLLEAQGRELQACPTSGGRQQPWRSLACGHTSAVAGLPVTWSVTSPLLSRTRTCATGFRAGLLLGPSSSASACFTPQTQSGLLLSLSLCRWLLASSSLLVPGLGSPQWLHVSHDQRLTQFHKGSCSFTWCLFDLPCEAQKREPCSEPVFSYPWMLFHRLSKMLAGVWGH